MAMAIHQNGEIQIGEWPNSKIGHSLRIWPFAYFGHLLVRTPPDFHSCDTGEKNVLKFKKH